MDKHTNFSSVATLRNLISGLETSMKQKHQQMQILKNEFLSIQRQHKDLQAIILFLEKKDESE